MTKISKEKFNYETFNNHLESKLVDYSDEDIEKIKSILDVINIELSINHKPYIIYIPFQDFPSDIQRFEIIDLLHKLDKDLGIIKFMQIVGSNLAEQEVDIRIEDNKIKFNELKKVVEEKCQDILKKKKFKSIKNSLPQEQQNEENKFEKLYRGEEIELKTLDIKIKDDFIIYKKKKSKKINPTDKQLIYFLYHRFIEDEQTCFRKDMLANELGTSAGNIKNRISFINQELRRLITKSKTNIDDFIKNEPRRGYRLNPRFMIQFTKKK